jgi:(p)ppGpp synthase/HD superfamily hydrolase
MTTTDAEQRAIRFAEQAHAAQRYGADAPYTVHLAAVRRVLADFGLAGDLAVAAWLHDSVEDTPTTREQVAALFGEPVAVLVWAVTGRGPNRKARNADAYAKIVAAGASAATLKLADRIANAEASRADNPRLLAMYRDELPAFEGMLAAAGLDRPEMLARLRAAFEGAAPSPG